MPADDSFYTLVAIASSALHQAGEIAAAADAPLASPNASTLIQQLGDSALDSLSLLERLGGNEDPLLPEREREGAREFLDHQLGVIASQIRAMVPDA